MPSPFEVLIISVGSVEEVSVVQKERSWNEAITYNT